MGSKPITQRAGTRYGSAPANQEVTVDAAGTTPARFARMTPLKQLKVDPNNPTTSQRHGEVKDDQNNLLQATETTTQYPDQTETINTGLDTELDPLQKVEGNVKQGGETDPNWINRMQSLLDKGYSFQDLATAKHGTVEGLTGLGLVEGRGSKPTDYMSVTKPGESSKEYDYKPVKQDVNTFEIRDARRRDRNIKRAGRVMNRALKKYGEESKEYESAKGAYDRFLEERKQGVNQAYQKEYKENVKAGKGTQTKAEFEGGGSSSNTSTNISNRFSNMSLGEMETAIGGGNKKPSLFTPGSSGLNIGNYQKDRTNSLSQFSFGGSNNLSGPSSSSTTQTSNFNILTSDPDKAQLGSGVQKRGNVGRGYKMGGYGNKNK